MGRLFESWMSKVPVWGKRSASADGHIELPKRVQVYLEKEFQLLPKDMAALQCAARKGSFQGTPADFVRIFDKAKARERGVTVKGYRDLDYHRDLVRFHGHIVKDGTVHLSDRRNNV